MASCGEGWAGLLQPGSVVEVVGLRVEKPGGGVEGQVGCR